MKMPQATSNGLTYLISVPGEKYKHHSLMTSPEDEHCHVRRKKSKIHCSFFLQCLKTELTLNICISSSGTNSASASPSPDTYGSYCISDHICFRTYVRVVKLTRENATLQLKHITKKTQTHNFNDSVL